MKLAFVVQRFGDNVVGGAESYCRQLAEQLVHSGHEVHIYTTTAIDETTWANEFPEGISHENGIVVHRFNSRIRRVPILTGLSLRVLASASSCIEALGLSNSSTVSRLICWFEQLFYVLQGPWSPKLVSAVVSDQKNVDAICFMTYLFYPTIKSLRFIDQHRYIIPTAHDEKAFSLFSTGRLLSDADCIFTLSGAELELITKRLPGVRDKTRILGYGIPSLDTVESLSHDVKQQLPTGNFLLFLGRISSGKGIEVLLSHFQRFRGEVSDDIRLVLAGSLQDIAIPKSSHVVYLGKVSEQDKHALIRRATAVVNPSEHESLSMAVIEAIAAGTPVLVNSKSPVLKAYAARFDTVTGYRNDQEFCDALAQIISHRTTSASNEFTKKLAKSAERARVEFSWDEVIRRFEAGIKTRKDKS